MNAIVKYSVTYAINDADIIFYKVREMLNRPIFNICDLTSSSNDELPSAEYITLKISELRTDKKLLTKLHNFLNDSYNISIAKTEVFNFLILIAGIDIIDEESNNLLHAALTVKQIPSKYVTENLISAIRLRKKLNLAFYYKPEIESICLYLVPNLEINMLNRKFIELDIPIDEDMEECSVNPLYLGDINQFRSLTSSLNVLSDVLGVNITSENFNDYINNLDISEFTDYLCIIADKLIIDYRHDFWKRKENTSIFSGEILSDFEKIISLNKQSSSKQAKEYFNSTISHIRLCTTI